MNANQNTVSTIATDLEQMQSDVNTIVANGSFSGLLDDCTLFNSDVTAAQGSLPVPDPTYQAIWSAVLTQAPGIVSACDAAVWTGNVALAQQVGTQVNTSLTQLVPLGRLLPQPLQPPTPFTGSAGQAGVPGLAAAGAPRSASRDGAEGSVPPGAG